MYNSFYFCSLVKLFNLEFVHHTLYVGYLDFPAFTQTSGGDSLIRLEHFLVAIVFLMFHDFCHL